MTVHTPEQPTAVVLAVSHTPWTSHPEREGGGEGRRERGGRRGRQERGGRVTGGVSEGGRELCYLPGP